METPRWYERVNKNNVAGPCERRLVNESPPLDHLSTRPELSVPDITVASRGCHYATTPVDHQSIAAFMQTLIVAIILRRYICTTSGISDGKMIVIEDQLHITITVYGIWHVYGILCTNKLPYRIVVHTTQRYTFVTGTSGVYEFTDPRAFRNS